VHITISHPIFALANESVTRAEQPLYCIRYWFVRWEGACVFFPRSPVARRGQKRYGPLPVSNQCPGIKYALRERDAFERCWLVGAAFSSHDVEQTNKQSIEVREDHEPTTPVYAPLGDPVIAGDHLTKKFGEFTALGGSTTKGGRRGERPPPRPRSSPFSKKLGLATTQKIYPYKGLKPNGKATMWGIPSCRAPSPLSPPLPFPRANESSSSSPPSYLSLCVRAD
jgi:hypothetical protein